VAIARNGPSRWAFHSQEPGAPLALVLPTFANLRRLQRRDALWPRRQRDRCLYASVEAVPRQGKMDPYAYFAQKANSLTTALNNPIQVAALIEALAKPRDHQAKASLF
jgi:hypothetical protein